MSPISITPLLLILCNSSNAPLQKKAKAAEAAKKLESIVPEIAAAAKDVASKPTEKKPLERLEKAKHAAEAV